MTKIYKKWLFFICGTVTLILGVIGIFLPILPTTPLILLSAFCYTRSSEKMYNYLIEHKVLGKYISNYINHKSIDKKSKILALIFLWCSLGISIYLIDNLYIKILLGIIGIGVSIHILMLKTLDL